MQELTINKGQIRSALLGDLLNLEEIILNTQLNAATCLVIHNEANHVMSGHQKSAVRLLKQGLFNHDQVLSYHCSLTLLGMMKLNPLLGADNGYDLKEGLACIENAAKIGNPWAMYLAATCYRLETGCDLDAEKAVKYYLRAIRILQDKQRIQNECVQLIAGGRDPQPFRLYLEHMVFAQNPARLVEYFGDNKPLLKEFVAITYSNEDPLFTEELKSTYATVLCPLTVVATENDSAFLFAWGMMNAELADRKLFRHEMNEFDTACQLATQCLERITRLNALPKLVTRLQNKLLRVSYHRIERTTDFTHPRKGAVGLLALQDVASDSVGFFLFAKLLLQYNTDDIFMNRKDKYRLILHYLSQVEIQDRDQCEGYFELLAVVIAHLIGIKPNEGATLLAETLMAKFDDIASVIMGYPVHFPVQDDKILYTPSLEMQWLGLEANQAKLVAHFRTANLKSFEYILYSSYCDAKAELDIVFLMKKLLAKLRSQLELAAAPSAELEIILGEHQLTRARAAERQQRELKTAQIPRALALRAIEKSAHEYEAAKKQHDYALMAWLKSWNDAKRCEDAHEFFKACQSSSDDVSLMTAIVKHIKEEQGRLNPTSFKFFLIRNLSEALNFGNIRSLDTDAAQFSLYFCETLTHFYIAPSVGAQAEMNILDFSPAPSSSNPVPASLRVEVVAVGADPLPLDAEDQSPLPPRCLDTADTAREHGPGFH